MFCIAFVFLQRAVAFFWAGYTLVCMRATGIPWEPLGYFHVPLNQSHLAAPSRTAFLGKCLLTCFQKIFPGIVQPQLPLNQAAREGIIICYDSMWFT